MFDTARGQSYLVKELRRKHSSRTAHAPVLYCGMRCGRSLAILNGFDWIIMTITVIRRVLTEHSDPEQNRLGVAFVGNVKVTSMR